MNLDPLSLTQIFVAVLGVISGAFAITWAVYFFTRKATIGRVISYMLIGEAVSMAAATYFAINSILHTYNALDPWEVILLRVVIFTTATGSTAHLVLYLRRLQRERELTDFENG